MKTPEELRKYYDEQLLGELRELEGRRKKTLLSIVILSVGAAFMGLVFLVVLALLARSANPCAPCGMILLPMMLLVGYIISYDMVKKKYVREFKSQVMPKIVKFMDEGLAYTPNNSIPKSTYMKSRIFLTHPDLYSGEDYVSGMVGKTRIEFSEIHSQDKTETRDSKGRRHTHYTTIFKGVFFAADFNKNFKGITLVLPDTAEKFFGSLLGAKLQSMNISRPPLVKLEDPEFEKLFVVYGDDQIEARYILSTSLMQRITEFRGKTKKSIYLSFVENKVMVAVPYSKNLFEPRLFRTILDYGQVEQYYQDLQLAVGIVEDLNLNTRIWGRE